MSLTITPLQLPEVLHIVPRVFADARGFFLESYKQSAYAAAIPEAFVQDNHSRSARGVIRGMHFQNPPAAQGKLVRVVHGAILDVAVDIRKDSPRYGQWVSAELTAENHHMLYIPTGFAHGFLSLADNTHVLYKTTAEYAPETDSGFCWNDPDINIDWQLAHYLPDIEPILSEKDAALAPLATANNQFHYDQFSTKLTHKDKTE